MSVSDLRGSGIPRTPGPGHGRTLSQDRSVTASDRQRGKSRTRGLADIDPKFISQVGRDYHRASHDIDHGLCLIVTAPTQPHLAGG